MEAPERGSGITNYAPPGLHYGCIMPIPSLQLQKKPVLYREAEGLVAELWCPGLLLRNIPISDVSM